MSEGGETRNHEAEVEAVARAIYDTQDNGLAWDNPTLGDWRKDYEREKARAAIAALDAVRRSPHDKTDRERAAERWNYMAGHGRSPQGEDHEAGCGEKVTPSHEKPPRTCATTDPADRQWFCAADWYEAEIKRLREEITDSDSWRCTDCNAFSRDDEAFCFNCGAGQPEYPARPAPERNTEKLVEALEAALYLAEDAHPQEARTMRARFLPEFEERSS